MGWGKAAGAQLLRHGDSQAPQGLDEGEVAVVQELAAIYGTPEEMVVLAFRMIKQWGPEAWKLLGEALGDARAYRVGEGSYEPDDIKLAESYERLAEKLGVTLL